MTYPLGGPLAGRRALVTGASGGIGRAVAIGLAARAASSGGHGQYHRPALIAGTRMLPGGAGGPDPSAVPVGHLGQPADIAGMAPAMLTNPYLTSKVITVDGGIYPA